MKNIKHRDAVVMLSARNRMGMARGYADDYTSIIKSIEQHSGSLNQIVSQSLEQVSSSYYRIKLGKVETLGVQSFLAEISRGSAIGALKIASGYYGSSIYGKAIDDEHIYVAAPNGARTESIVRALSNAIVDEILITVDSIKGTPQYDEALNATRNIVAKSRSFERDSAMTM